MQLQEVHRQYEQAFAATKMNEQNKQPAVENKAQF